MSRVRGSKRQQIINNWLNGHDDPEYEVLPTKTEGKFIVKKRQSPIEVQKSVPPPVKEEEQPKSDSEKEEEEIEEEAPAPVPQKPIPKSKPKTKKQVASQDSEILQSIRSLGNELQKERERKKQKKLIKKTVQEQLAKELYQQQFRGYVPSRFIPEPIPEQQEEIPEPEPEQQETPQEIPPQYYIRRSRVNLRM